jgi:HK97 family phage portal protein
VDSKDKALDSHPLTELLLRVNDEETPADLWSAYVIHMLLGGETFYELVPDTRGRPAEIWLRRPDQVGVVPDASRLNYPTAIGYLFEGEDNQAVPIDAPYMVHDKFYNPLNAWRGLAPIHAIREGITIDLYAQAWSKGFLRSNARPDFAVIAPQGVTTGEVERIEEKFLFKFSGVENAHRPIILEEGITDIKTFSFPPKDIEWLEQRKYSRDEVGAIFGVPDEIMGYGKDTYENFETALTVFWTLTLLPFVRRRDVTLTNHFAKHSQGLRPGERIDTDLSDVGVLQEDLTPKVDLARKFWDMGVPFNILDKTLGLGVGPVDGGEIGYLLGSLKTVEQVANPPEPSPVLPANGAPNQPPMDDEPPPTRAFIAPRYLLPDGAKEQARRALKKLIQGIQDDHLRAIRHGAGIDPNWNLDGYDRTEFRRWLGDEADNVIWGLEKAIQSISGDHDRVNTCYANLKSDEMLTRLLEVAAPTFFTVSLPNGDITLEAYKSLLLQLDPEDDEKELRIREALERRTTRNLHAVFQDMIETLYPQGYGEFLDPNLEAQRVRRLFDEEQKLYDTLSRALQDGADLGVSAAVAGLENIGFGFDYTLANESARAWASQHSGTLISQISDTTQRGVRDGVARWIQNGEPLETLIGDLQIYFGRARAERIAVTEVTRAYAEGNLVAWRESGVVEQVEWRTSADEMVCKICGVRHKKRAPLDMPQIDGRGIPAHVRCRCWWAGVIE